VFQESLSLSLIKQIKACVVPLVQAPLSFLNSLAVSVAVLGPGSILFAFKLRFYVTNLKNVIKVKQSEENYQHSDDIQY